MKSFLSPFIFLLILSSAHGQGHSLKPVRQISIAQSGLTAKGIYGIGRSPKTIREFQGISVTFLQFRLPTVPEGKVILRGQLKLRADYISSKKYTPRAWVNVVKGKLPKPLTWENHPRGIHLTRTRSVEVKERGPFAIDIPEGLRSGKEVVLRVGGGGGGHRSVG